MQKRTAIHSTFMILALGSAISLAQSVVAEEPPADDAALEALGTDAEVPADKEGDSLSAHQHGIGRLDLAMDGGHFALELTLTAHDVVGFEHKAKTADEKAKAAKAKATLEDPSKLFSFAESAGCTVLVEDVANSIEESGEEESESATEGGEHADYLASYVVSCKEIGKLSSVPVKLFSLFPSLASLKVQATTAKGPRSSVLTKDKADIEGL